MQKQIALHNKMDHRWGIEQKAREKDSEGRMDIDNMAEPQASQGITGISELTFDDDRIRMQVTN